MRHHWVQEAYLKAWRDPDTPSGQEPYVWVFHKEGRVGKKRAPRKLFRLADLYKDRRDKAATNPMWFEAGISRIESEFIRVRDTVVAKGGVLNEFDQAVLATYVGLSFVRTPKYIDHAAGPWRQMVGMMDEMRESFTRTPPGARTQSPDLFRHSIEAQEQSISEEETREAASHPAQTVLAPLVNGQAKILAQMTCILLMTNQDSGFITSDSPCVHFNEKDLLNPSFMGGGMASSSHEVTFPVMPGCLAFFGWSKRKENNGHCWYQEADGIVVDEMNWRTRTFCHNKFVVRRDITRDYWFDRGQAADIEAGQGTVEPTDP
jgi:Protein of unknown function (DUF4238)